MYNSTVKAIREHNAARKEACLWKLLRALFLGKTLAQIFVIIHLPTDAKFQTPFLELIKDLTTLVKSTEIHTKIIVLQKQSTTTNQDYPLLRKDIHHDDSEVRSALEKDFTEELGWMCSNKPQIVGPQAKVVKLLQGAVDLHLSKICLAMIQQQVCFSLKLLKGVLMARSNKELASLLLSLIPNAYQSWVQLGLAWATSAIRPLTRREFAEVLLLPDGSGGCMESLDSPVDEFTRLLSGLVEVEADTIHIANLELCKHLLYLIQETAGTTDFDPRTKRGDQGGPQFLDSERFQSQVHLDITQRCLAYLSRHKGIQVAGNSESNLRHSDHSDMEDSKAPLLQYAVEHWFTHLKLSQNSKVLTELTAVVDFIQDKNQVHQWMKLRTTYWKSRQDSGQSYSPSLKLLAEMISLQTSNNVDMIQAIELALDVSIIVKGPARNPWHYLVLAAAQRGQTDVLRRLIDKGCLEDESTLEAVFETGCEGMLCNLLPIIKTKGIRHNIQNIIYRAILSGSYALVCGLQAEFRDSINLANYETPLLNLIAENAGTNPPDSLLKDLRSGLNSIVRGGTVLHAAASSGHVDLMPILLSTISEPEVKVNCQDTSQSSPLHLATKNGHFIVVEQLLAAGSDVRLRDKAGQTSLHLASANGYTDIANALVEHKASISSEDKKSRTPLHMALECGHRELCLMLINKLATSSSERDAFDLDSRDSKGLTLLLLAVSSNFLAAVRSLLELGVDANTACAKGTPPLIYAAKCGFYDIVVELLGAPGIVVEARENNSNTPLHYAAFRNSPLVIGKLKEHGAKCGTQNSSGRTPLASACMRDHVAAVKTLLPGVSPEDLGIPYYTTSMFASFKVLHLVLNAGVDIDSNWDHVGTALHIASYNSQPRTVELLLLRGADFEQRDSNGRTPLMDAIMQNSIECVRLLVNARASLKVEDNDGYTPLLHAASRDHLDCIQILFEAKAEFNIPAGISSDYAMPMDLALLICPIKSFEMVIDHLLARSSSLSLSPDTLLKYLAEEGCDVNKIKILLERVSTWDPNATIGSYGTMLHYAALWGRLDLTKLLIDSKRVQIDANTKSYGTPLEVASGQGFNPDIVHLLLERGASITSGSVLTGTPLHAASSMSKRWEEKAEEKYLTIAKAILDYDISGLNIVAGFYGTPLCAAASSGTIAMVETLLEYRPDCELQGTASGTALHVAARKGRAKVVELLLGYMSPGLSPETTDTVGHIPIHMAASGGHTDLIGVLAKPEAILLARDFEERHSLHFAAGTGSLDFVRHILTQHPEAVNDVDCDGWSPLHWACRQRSTDVVKLLLDKRADKFAKTKKGWLPMHVAIYHGFKTIAQIVETSTMDNGECKPQHASEVELANEQEMMPPKTQFIARSERYANFTCDSCYCVSILPKSRPICKRRI
jgi:ankyrin repeat protein